MQGISGRLLSEYFVTHLLAARFARDLDPDGARRAHSAFVRLHRTWRAQLGPASGVRAVFDVAAVPFMHMLQFRVGEQRVAAGPSLVAAAEAGGANAAVILVTTWGGELDSRWRDAVEAGLELGLRWIVCFNGRSVRVVDAVRCQSRAHAEFDLDEIADCPQAFEVLWAALRARALSAGDERPLLDRMVEASSEAGEAVCQSLRHGVLDSVGLLLDALCHARRTSPPDADAVAVTFEQALTIVYRILFLLFAEARQLVPQWHPVYRDRYTIEALKRLSNAARHPRGLWEALQAISRLAHEGCEAGDLHVVPFNGRLFSPRATPLAEGARLSDDIARDALMALATTGPRAGGREPIAYRDLGVEELGAVYETILDYTPAVRGGARGDGWQVTLERGGHQRKDSSTFYTPRSLTDLVVRRTLEPLVAGRDSDALLDLRIVDPAMGSGAFLVSACRYLARAYEQRLTDEGRCLPGDMTDDDRARLRRVIAQRCLFGVDINRRAVQLARLSLWLATLAADCPLTFLDHHLRAGDSLVGASPDDVWRQPPGRGRRQPAPVPLLDIGALQADLTHVVPERARIASEPGDTIDAVREKERALAALTAETSRWSEVCDLWCAAWFWPDGGLDGRTFADLADRLLGRGSLLPSSTAESHVATGRRIAAALNCFHWPLEFPEIFFDPSGAPLGDGAGFDAVIGNPPWDMIRADRPGDASDDGRRHTRALSRFFRESGIFRANREGHANRYQLFIERALQLAKSGGRVGLVVPSGLATDHGSAELRRVLFAASDTDGLIGFDNRDGVFPIHRSTKFLVVTATRGRPTAAVRCRFGVRAPDALGTPHGNANQALVLTPELIRRISGDDLAIPELHSPLDLEIVEEIAFRFPALASRDGWSIKFGRELNATDDRRSFVDDPDGIPIVEGKDIAPFAVRLRHDASRIKAGDAERLLGRIPARRLAYRDVASATNRLTLIAAILPERTVSVHTLFCLKTSMALRSQRFLSAVLNSLVANYLIRMRVTTHVGVRSVERLPAPRCAADSPDFQSVVELVERLEDSEGKDDTAYAALQGLIAGLYGLDERKWRHVLSTFPLIDVGLRNECAKSLRALSGHEGTKARRDL